MTEIIVCTPTTQNIQEVAFNHFRLCFLNRLSELCNFHLVHQLEQVGFIYLIQKMHGFLSLIITVNDDIEVVSVFGNGSNELLSAFRR